MAVQSRRGNYSDFDPEKMVPGEWATVLSGDPNASDGKSIYHCFSAGNVKRMATYEDMEDNINKATDNIRNEFLEDINNATQSASAAATSANHAAQLAQQAAEDAQEVTNAIEGAVEGTIINDQMPSEVTTFSGEHIKNTYLGKSGDGSKLTITFEQATQRANIQSGDSLAVAFGKLAKFCADLDNHAFSAPVNNLTGTDPSLPLASPQGKVLDDKITNVDGRLPFVNVADATDGSAFSKNFLGVGIQDPNVEKNKRAYFIISPDERGEFSNVPPDLFYENTYSVGVREVYRLGTTLIMVRITEISPRPGRQYYRTYNSGSWNSSGWRVISPE